MSRYIPQEQVLRIISSLADFLIPATARHSFFSVWRKYSRRHVPNTGNSSKRNFGTQTFSSLMKLYIRFFLAFLPFLWHIALRTDDKYFPTFYYSNNEECNKLESLLYIYISYNVINCKIQYVYVCACACVNSYADLIHSEM